MKGDPQDEVDLLPEDPQDQLDPLRVSFNKGYPLEVSLHYVDQNDVFAVLVEE